MAPISSTEFTPVEQKALLLLARDTITARVEPRHRPRQSPPLFSDKLQQQAATFVTLHRVTAEARHLRGCIGSLEATRSLFEDIREHALAAAFHDPRFPPLGAAELEMIDIEISVLSPQEPVRAASDTELLSQIEAGHHGLTIDDGLHRATFLPGVWQQLPEKLQFLEHLKRKAGLQRTDWPQQLRCWRYHTISFSESELGL